MWCWANCSVCAYIHIHITYWHCIILYVEIICILYSCWILIDHILECICNIQKYVYIIYIVLKIYIRNIIYYKTHVISRDTICILHVAYCILILSIDITESFLALHSLFWYYVVFSGTTYSFMVLHIHIWYYIFILNMIIHITY